MATGTGIPNVQDGVAGCEVMHPTSVRVVIWDLQRMDAYKADKSLSKKLECSKYCVLWEESATFAILQ